MYGGVLSVFIQFLCEKLRECICQHFKARLKGQSSLPVWFIRTFLITFISGGFAEDIFGEFMCVCVCVCGVCAGVII